nr:glyoxalase [candidate division KSB1 bacterium]NIV05184.1 glyoxalase [candidate division Zixibacteria bacterium]NIS23258.1 glyoxalase [candidate division KSB1 bacterium]NIT70140.1 glyoxalase [candidate division KSB1 bacterium]NIU23790.1 glyoxalase [candidate division KSB1 bacterium]
IVEFIARHNLDNASEEEKFSANSILSVSEIGIPVEDVRLFSQHLQQEQEIPLWDGDEKKFAALGDEEGLFIVVPLGRPWLPVGPPAKEFPVTVDI